MKRREVAFKPTGLKASTRRQSDEEDDEAKSQHLVKMLCSVVGATAEQAYVMFKSV